MPDPTPTLAEYESWSQIWPVADLNRMLAPVRVGMDRRTGKMLVGWDHVQQSLEMLFATPYHQRILRQWVGSFVPALLGENITQPTITRFWWAIIAAVDLWEPDYSIKQIFMQSVGATILSNPTSVDGIRKGTVSFAYQGQYYPRGHLGDRTPDTLRSSLLTGRGDGSFAVTTP